MKDHFLTRLRDSSTEPAQFRQAAHQLASLLAAESGELLTCSPLRVKTPIAEAAGARLDRPPILISILRSGLILLPAFLELYPSAPIGLIGVRRDELTAEPHLYFSNLPRISKEDQIFLLDPMVATGQSASLAADLLIKAGAREANIALISILAAPEGIQLLKMRHPEINLRVAQIDERLDPKKWIVPGLGDFGDRYFGT